MAYRSTDELGVEHDLEVPIAPGRKAATASKPVVLSTEDLAALNAVAASINTLLRATALPVSAASLPLPSGAATDASLGAKLDDLIAAIGPADLTDASISSATGSSQEALAADSDRRYLLIANPNAANAVWVNPTGGTAAANGAGSFRLAAGERWEPIVVPTDAINVIATAADKVTVVHA